MKVTITQNGVELAEGKLTVDKKNTPPGPITATFKPKNGTEVNCTVTTWSEQANGAVAFSFVVTGSANGDFPCGANGTSYTYNFTGNENSNGTFPSGAVNFPEGVSIKAGGGDNPTWQSEADEDEPISLNASAS